MSESQVDKRVKIVSYSELDAARQCFFKHEMAYKERWTPPTESPALARGTAWHKLMETHYGMIRERLRGEAAWTDDQIIEAVFRIHLADDNGQQSKEQELLEWIYRGHVEYWGFDDDWRVQAVEFSPTVWLPSPSGHRSNFKLKLKIDLVVKIKIAGKWQLVIVDHKTGKDLPKQKELDIDDQFGLYTWAMRQLGHDVLYSIHNAARTHRNVDQVKHFQPLDERFRRTPTHRTDIELDVLAHEAYQWAKLAYQHKIGEAPRSANPDTCSWKCPFTDACLYGRKGGDHRRMLEDMGFRQDYTRH